jgi:predicted small lipoprotein YifL
MRPPRLAARAAGAALAGALAALAGALAACGAAGPDVDAPDAATASVELGTGETTFVPITAEADLPLHAGPQGGHHFIVHARVVGLDPGDPDRAGIPANPSTSFAAYAEDGRRLDLMYPPYRLGYLATGGDAHDLPGGRILQLEESEVAGLWGARVRVTVHVKDQAGREAGDERWVHVAEVGAADAGPP